MKKSFSRVVAILLVLALPVCAGAVTAAADPTLAGFSVTFDEPYCFFESDEITMYANSIEVDDWDYLAIDTLVVNHKEGTEIEVTIPRAAVNGVEIYPTYWEDVEDECTEPIEIDLSNVLENAAIADITDIELNIHIEEDFDILHDETVHIYPYGKDKAVKYERKAADTDIVLVDNSQFAISVIGCEYVEDWGYSVHLYVQNKLQEPIRLEGEYFKMNDVVVDTWYDDVVGGGGVCFTHVEWSQGDLDDAEITAVESVRFILRVYNDAMDDLLCDKEVVLNP